MRIATWNVNSIRARLDHVERWLRQAHPDILCLQETKVEDSSFPTDTFSRQGYETVLSGERSYNGVAILARHPIDDVTIGLADHSPEDGQRLIAANVRGVRVVSAYVPNGKNLESPMYQRKLEWLSRLKSTLERTCTPGSPLVVCGDFNIAREELDVFDVERMKGQLHFTDEEHRALDELLAYGLYDAFRRKNRETKAFSWWDYRMGAFRRNRGLRIDYVFVNQPILQVLENALIDTEPRAWEKPSDHAPVLIDFPWNHSDGS